MQRITIEAKATATDLGEFVAIAAAYSRDRAGDRIVPGAFAKTIDRWQASGKQVPLHWNHQGEPDDIIGTIDPFAMRETDDGLQVAGRIDLDGSAKGREAWRSIKAGAMSLSFGYMVVKEAPAKDANELHELDLFEVSVVPGPANADTRFLELKSVPEMGPEEIREEIAQLRKRLDELEDAQDDTPADDVEDEPEQTPVVTQQASDPEATAIDLALIEALNV